MDEAFNNGMTTDRLIALKAALNERGMDRGLPQLLRDAVQYSERLQRKHSSGKTLAKSG